MKIREKLEKIEKEFVYLGEREHKEVFNRYYGLLVYSLDNCKNAYEDLKEFNKELNDALENKSNVKDINKIGRLNRVLKDYLIIKIRTLFVVDTRTLSFIQLARFLLKNNPETGRKFVGELKIIGDKYQETLDQLDLIANKVVVHAEDTKVEIINTAELLEKPILELVDDLMRLLIRYSSIFD